MPLDQAVFFGRTPPEIETFFTELDYLVSLDLLSATEAALRVDFHRRVADKKKDPLSRQFREIRKHSGKAISFDTHILDRWSAERPTVRSTIADFRGAMKLRDWLAHGRYWTPKFGKPNYPVADIYVICARLLIEAQLLKA